MLIEAMFSLVLAMPAAPAPATFVLVMKDGTRIPVAKIQIGNAVVAVVIKKELVDLQRSGAVRPAATIAEELDDRGRVIIRPDIPPDEAAPPRTRTTTAMPRTPTADRHAALTKEWRPKFQRVSNSYRYWAKLVREQETRIRTGDRAAKSVATDMKARYLVKQREVKREWNALKERARRAGVPPVVYRSGP